MMRKPVASSTELPLVIAITIALLFAWSCPAISETISIEYVQVATIEQPNDMSCWSAAAAMVLGSASCVTAAGTFGGGLPANFTSLSQFADAFQLKLVANSSWTVSGMKTILEQNGPAWILIKGSNFRHAVALIGLKGDGTPDNTTAIYIDPWPPAARKESTFRDFFEGNPQVETIIYPLVKIYH